jgi:hypothetical protein
MITFTELYAAGLAAGERAIERGEYAVYRHLLLTRSTTVDDWNRGFTAAYSDFVPDDAIVAID